MSYDNSPAEVLRAALVSGSIGATPSPSLSVTWPAYVGHLADKPDNAMCIYDTAGNQDGRLQASGARVYHPGWQIRVRGVSYGVAYAKVKAIGLYLDGVHNKSVVIGTDTYIVACVKQTSGIFSMGRETDGARRDEFVLNGTMTITT